VKQQPTACMPKAGIIILALCLIGLVLVAVYSRTGPPPAAAQNQLVWVRQDPPEINFLNDPVFWECPEGVHCEGSFWDYILDETEIVKEERYVNNGHEYYHIILRSVFDRPPQVMNPGSRYTVRANFSHNKVSGDPTYAECLYFQYHDPARPWLAEPPWEHAYCPWHEDFDGTAGAAWVLDPGWPFKEGDTLEVRAEWIFDDPANVTWTYRAEPANLNGDDARLGAEVIAPVVEYQGEEVATREIFYPETCPLPGGRAATDCSHRIGMRDDAKAELACYKAAGERLKTLFTILDVDTSFMEGLNPTDAKLFFFLVLTKLVENCLDTRAAGDYQFDLFLEQGDLLLDGHIASQTLTVHTTLGSATAGQPSAFVAGYNPQSQTAIFQTYGAPLTVQPKTGPPLVLQPNQQVEVTGDGPGPVTDLPHLFLPVQIR
jgi:hypothetical protein